MTYNWPDIATFTSPDYKKARYEAHNAVFWMARGAHSYLDTLPQNKHLDMHWQRDRETLCTQVFDGDLQIGLSIPKLEIYFCENGEKVRHSFWFDDRTPAYAEAWYLVELLHRDRDRSKFTIELPFESKDFFLGDTDEHDAPAVANELKAMHDCLVIAESILSQVQKNLADSDDAISEIGAISCKPENFTLSFEILTKPAEQANILVGMSLGDDLRPAPFFFVSKNYPESSKNKHVLDFEAANLLSLNKMSENNMDDAAVINQLLQDAKSCLS
ncbi:MAG: hypothetical protein HOH48_07390 [Candidatus Puniceispirillum sp.]|mgnify:CR=1 FL=1|uniref:hypothetical protein n=1 Tax=Candidatus Puniceispirillum sp. TaxID=2026719 RepID=UPI001EBA3915|nr:hypothetical protein [Candidatus Puniceispirillum sp.]MBT6414935.1 hypothetical protein [Candidatus Puniceispirillum sp.]MBT6566582.1 hypothetical protein [Candidatus Puniceispirillum sp.]